MNRRLEIQSRKEVGDPIKRSKGQSTIVVFYIAMHIYRWAMYIMLIHLERVSRAWRSEVINDPSFYVWWMKN